MSLIGEYRGYLIVGVAPGLLACGASSPLFEGNASSDAGTPNTTGGLGGKGSGGASSGGANGDAVNTGGTSGTAGGGFGGTGGRRGTGGTGTGGTEPYPTGGSGSVVRPTGGTGGQIVTQPSCPQSSFRGSPPHHLLGSTSGVADTFTPSCGAIRGSGDYSFVWQVPYSGRFKFDTKDSNFDTVLAVQDGVCSGEELACSDDTQGSAASEVTLDLQGGQQVTIVVDGYGGTEGSVTVHITELRGCPDGELGSRSFPTTLAGDTGIYTDRYTAACGAGAGSPDYAATFTPFFAGTYSFDTQGSDFDTVLAVYEGVCGLKELACNDDDMGITSLVAMPLEAGQQVTVVVDGFGGSQGSFRLSVDVSGVGSCCEAHPTSAGCAPVEVARCVCADLPYCCSDGWDESCAEAVVERGCGSCEDCPDDVLGDRPPLSVSGSTVDQQDRHTSECGSAAGSGDYVMQYTIPYRSTYVFDTRGSTFDTVLSLKRGGCFGPLLDCNDDSKYGSITSMIAATFEAGETVAVIVDGYDGEEGDFVLNVADQKTAGDCCFETPQVPGCRNSALAECVCKYDPSCCEVAWTHDCVMHIADLDCGDCFFSVYD